MFKYRQHFTTYCIRIRQASFFILNLLLFLTGTILPTSSDVSASSDVDMLDMLDMVERLDW